MGSKTTLHVTTLLGSLGPYYVTCYYAAEISGIVATLLVTTGFQFPIISVSKYQSQFPNTFFQFPNTTPSFRIPLSSFRIPLPVSEYQFPNTTPQFPNTTVQFPNTTVQFPNTTVQFPNTSFRIPVSEYHLQFPNTTRQFPNTTVTETNRNKVGYVSTNSLLEEQKSVSFDCSVTLPLCLCVLSWVSCLSSGGWVWILVGDEWEARIAKFSGRTSSYSFLCVSSTGSPMPIGWGWKPNVEAIWSNEAMCHAMPLETVWEFSNFSHVQMCLRVMFIVH